MIDLYFDTLAGMLRLWPAGPAPCIFWTDFRQGWFMSLKRVTYARSPRRGAPGLPEAQGASAPVRKQYLLPSCFWCKFSLQIRRSSGKIQGKGGFFMMDLCNAQEVRGYWPARLQVFQGQGPKLSLPPGFPSEFGGGIRDRPRLWRAGGGSRHRAPTQQLCRRAGRVTAVEVDRSLAPVFAGDSRGILQSPHPLAGYFLKVDIPLWCRQSFRDFVPWPAPTCPIISPPGPHCPAGPGAFLCHRHGSEGGGPADGRRPGSGDSSAFTVFCNYYAQPGFSSTCPLASCLSQGDLQCGSPWTSGSRLPALGGRGSVLPGGAGQLCPAAQAAANSLTAGFPALGRRRSEKSSAAGLSPTVRGNPGHSGLCPDRRRHWPRLRSPYVSISLFLIWMTPCWFSPG